MGSVNRTDLFFGEPGTGKSLAALEIIRREYRRARKKARVYVGDGSAATYLDSGLVDAGIIHLMDYSTKPYPMTITQQMTDGMWPEDPENPLSKMRPLTPEERAETGVWVFEGVSVMGLYLMGHVQGGLAQQAGQGVKIGGDANVAFQDAEIDTTTGRYKAGTGTGQKWGGSNLAHYMVAQGHMLDRINRSKALPGWVIWTGHEVSAEDKMTGEKVIGPEMAGSAKSASLSRVFNNTLHFTIALKDQGRAKVKDEYTKADVRQAEMDYRLYTRSHYDPDGLSNARYMAVVRTPMPEMVKLYYSGKPGEAVSALYDDIEKSKKEYAKRALEGLVEPEAEGLKKGVA